MNKLIKFEMTAGSVFALMIGLGTSSAFAGCTIDMMKKTADCVADDKSELDMNFKAPDSDGWQVTIEKGAILDGSGARKNAIYIVGGQNTITNNGVLGQKGQMAINSNGGNFTLKNSETGKLTSGYITVNASNLSGNSLIENKGIMEGGSVNIIKASGSGVLTLNNQGTIQLVGSSLSPNVTIDLKIDKAVVYNTGKGQLLGNGNEKSAVINYSNVTGILEVTNSVDAKIFMFNPQGFAIKSLGSLTVNNQGRIWGKILSDQYDDSIDNSGDIESDTISLGDGNNHLVNHSGTDPYNIPRIIGNITTGAGNDTIENHSLIDGKITTGGGSDTITNDGKITGKIDFTKGTGLGFDLGNSTLTNQAGGILSSAEGIQLGFGKTNTITNEGKIFGPLVDSATSSTNTITNSGEILDDMKLSHSTNIITNQLGGVIGGVTPGAKTITLGNAARGDQVSNEGVINSKIILGDGTNAVLNLKNGVFAGDVTGGKDADGVLNYGILTGKLSTGDGNDTVGNYGSASDINLEGGDDTLILGVGMKLTGVVDGGLDNDLLVLDGGVVGQSTILNSEIKNMEVLNVKGDARWILDKDYSFSISTDVAGNSQLEIATGRTLTTAKTMVEAAGTLTGNGTLKSDLTVDKGGTLKPGDGRTGTLTVQGNYVSGPTGTFAAGVGPGNVQSKLLVSGTAALSGTLKIDVAAGFYRAGTSYDVIEATGGVSGTFGTETLLGGNRFTKFSTKYLSNKVQILVSKLNYNEVARTYNQRQAGNGLFNAVSAVNGGSDLENVASVFEALPNDGAMRQALDSLSGELWPVADVAGRNINRSLQHQALNRTYSAEEGVEIWGGVMNNNDQTPSDGNGAQIKDTVKGAVAGLEYGFNWGKVGVMAGYGDGQVKLSERGSKADIQVMQGSVYGGINLGGFEINLVGSYAEEKVDGSRLIQVGNIQRTAKGHGTNHELSGELQVGYGIDLGAIQLLPTLGVEGLCRQDGKVTEKGGQDVGLIVEKQKTCQVDATAGFQIKGVFNLGAVKLMPVVGASYSRMVAGEIPLSRDVAFEGSPNLGGFNVRAADTGRDTYRLSGGVGISFFNVDLQLSYGQTLHSKVKEQNISANLGIRF